MENGLERLGVETLLKFRGNLNAILDRAADHMDAGTLNVLGPKDRMPPAGWGWVALYMRDGIDQELEKRRAG